MSDVVAVLTVLTLILFAGSLVLVFMAHKRDPRPRRLYLAQALLVVSAACFAGLTLLGNARGLLPSTLLVAGLVLVLPGAWMTWQELRRHLRSVGLATTRGDHTEVG